MLNFDNSFHALSRFQSAGVGADTSMSSASGDKGTEDRCRDFTKTYNSIRDGNRQVSKLGQARSIPYFPILFPPYIFLATIRPCTAGEKTASFV